MVSLRAAHNNNYAARIFMCVRDSVIFDAQLPCAHTSRRFSSFTSRAGHRYIQGRIEHVVRVCVYIRILLILILKSRALTTITQRIESDAKKIRDYATVFRDSGSEVIFPELSRKFREGWQVCSDVYA